MIGGYEIQTAADGEEGLRIWKTWKPDVIVSDIEMPVMDGYEMVHRIRETDDRTPKMVHRIRETDDRTPILFTSGRVSPKDVVKGYELGVNNYIKKPFLPEELHAHITALLKMTQGRQAEPHEAVFAIGKMYTFNADRSTLSKESGDMETLTVREADLLRLLCESKGKVVRREVILSRLWNTEDDYFASRSLDVFVSRLRKLLSADESVQLKTVKGVGLQLVD